MSSVKAFSLTPEKSESKHSGNSGVLSLDVIQNTQKSYCDDGRSGCRGQVPQVLGAHWSDMTPAVSGGVVCVIACEGDLSRAQRHPDESLHSALLLASQTGHGVIKLR